MLCFTIHMIMPEIIKWYNQRQHIRDLRNFAKKSIWEQARVADPVCVEYIDDVGFITSQINNSNTDDFHIWNKTSLANLAYIATYFKNKEVQEKCISILGEYKDWIDAQ
jgi:hypothetical protein